MSDDRGVGVAVLVDEPFAAKKGRRSAKDGKREGDRDVLLCQVGVAGADVASVKLLELGVGGVSKLGLRRRT